MCKKLMKKAEEEALRVWYNGKIGLNILSEDEEYCYFLLNDGKLGVRFPKKKMMVRCEHIPNYKMRGVKSEYFDGERMEVDDVRFKVIDGRKMMILRCNGKDYVTDYEDIEKYVKLLDSVIYYISPDERVALIQADCKIIGIFGVKVYEKVD